MLRDMFWERDNLHHNNGDFKHKRERGIATLMSIDRSECVSINVRTFGGM